MITKTPQPITPRLLIVDDEPLVLKMVKNLLSRSAYDVATCDSAHRGLKLLNDGVFDCIITDAIMPDMDGYDFVRAIRRQPQFSSLPILMLTRKRNRQDVKKAAEVGVTDYVIKPIDENLFLDKVELCLKKGMGKRHVYELQLTPPLSQAGILMSCEILSISETDLTLWSQVPLTEDMPFILKTPLFHEIQIDVPHLKLIKCELVSDSETQLPGYEIKFGFLGLAEEELQKIRSWIQREIIRRKKSP